MSLHSIAVAGLRTIKHIANLHPLRFQRKQNGLAITVELLASSLPGAPVIDEEGRCVGFISEFDVLNALESEREIAQLTAEDIMVPNPISVTMSTTIKEAVTLMKDHHLLVLPVEEGRKIIGSVTRKALLEAWIGIGLHAST
jgi:CBS domain-containing protein